MKFKILATTLVTYLCISVISFCSDGVDRHKKFSPNTFYLFDQPVIGCGYSVLAKDSEGGADGTLEFRWAQKHLISLVKICAYETEKQFGKSQFPLLIFDGCAEDGDTPVDWEPQPSGRHPGGSHDGGLNLDLGYYLLSLKGKEYTPDYSACSNHFEPSNNGEQKDAWICKDNPDKLDVERMSYFYLKMLSLNKDLFSKELLGQIGADYYVKEAVIKKIKEWISDNKYGATQELLDDFERIVTCNEFEGWAKSHHHHTHIRLNDVESYGKLRKAFEILFAKEREIDYLLLKQNENKNVAIKVRLFSTGLERGVEAELLNEESLKDIRFKFGDSDWVEPLKSEKRIAAYFELPSSLILERKNFRVYAQFVNSEGKLESLSTEITLPIQDPRLYIEFDPSKFNFLLSKTDKYLFIEAVYPDIYNALITNYIIEIKSIDGTSTIYAKYPTHKINIDLGKLSSPAMVNAVIILCGRKQYSFPLIINCQSSK